MVPLSWAGWLRGRGPELLLRYHVRVARVTEVHWAHILHRPPTASPVELGTGVLCVNRDPPVWLSIQAGWWRNQSASLTYTGRRATIIEEMWIIDVCSCIESVKKTTQIEKRFIKEAQFYESFTKSSILWVIFLKEDFDFLSLFFWHKVQFFESYKWKKKRFNSVSHL